MHVPKTAESARQMNNFIWLPQLSAAPGSVMSRKQLGLPRQQHTFEGDCAAPAPLCSGLSWLKCKVAGDSSTLRACKDLSRQKKVLIWQASHFFSVLTCTVLQGLEKYGIGKWREISENLLPKYDDQVRLFSCFELSMICHANWLLNVGASKNS